MAETIEVSMIVEAISKGFEKISGDLNKADTSTGKLTQSFKTANVASDKWGRGINDITRQVTGFDLSTLSAAGAVMAILGAMKKAISVEVQYSDQVAKLSGAMGATYEDTSRLIQVTDDYFVSVENLTIAMKTAVRQGIAPGVEGLAQISDKYLSLTDAQDRATYAQKMLGRQWIELIPILIQGGDAIRKQAAAIDDSLVVTEESRKKVLAYKIELDALSDSAMGVWRSIAQYLIPALTFGIEYFKEAFKPGFTPFFEKMFSSGEKATVEFNRLMAEAKKRIDAEQAAAKGAAGAMDDLGNAEEDTKKDTEKLTAATKDLTKAGDYLKRNQRLRFDESDIQKRREQIAEAKKQLEDLTKEKYQAQLDLKMTITSAAKSLGDQINSAIEAAIKSAGLKEKAFSVTDLIFGTDAVRQLHLGEMIDAAIAEFKKTKDIGAFTEAMQGIYDWIIPSDPTVKAAQAQLQLVEDEITKLQNMPKRYDIYVHTWFISHGDRTGIGGGAGGGGSNPNERIGGESYRTGGSGLTLNGGIHVTAAPGMNERMVAQMTVLALTRRQRTARNNGSWSVGAL